MHAGGRVTIQRTGKREAFEELSDSQQRKNACQEEAVEIIFFHKPFTRLFGFFVHLFPVEETQQCVRVPGKLSFRKEKIQWSPCFMPGNLDLSC